jgi:hypothetical protein
LVCEYQYVLISLVLVYRARTGFGNFESSYFDDMGNEAEMMQVAEAVDGAGWDDDYLPDPRLPTSGKAALQNVSSQMKWPEPPRAKNSTPKIHKQNSAPHQWSSFSQLQNTASDKVKQLSSYPTKSWNTSGLSKSSPISITDDDLEEDRLPVIQGPRLGQVFAWSKSKGNTKQFPYPKQTDDGDCTRESLRPAHDLKRPATNPSTSFISAKRVYDKEIG